MKLLRLEIHNIASLAGTHRLDFNQGSLADSGLIAITGPTGSGKSTLLDALCLALFDAIPRLKTANSGLDGRLPDIDSELRFSNPKTLLRRGCGYGYVEAQITGIDQHVYRIRWEVRRARKSHLGKLQQTERLIEDVTTGTLLANTLNECQSLIEARLGLNFVQFTRAVLLAQADFAAFLKASDKERAELLECLTGTEIYSRIGKFAGETLKIHAASVAQLESQLAGALSLTDSEREQLLSDIARHQHSLSKLEQQEQVRQQALRWYEQLVHWQSESQDLEKHLEESTTRWQELQPVRRLLTLWPAYTEWRPLEQQYQHSFKKREELAHQQETLRSELQQCQQQRSQCQTELNLKQAAYSEAVDALKRFAPHIAQLQNLENTKKFIENQHLDSETHLASRIRQCSGLEQEQANAERRINEYTADSQQLQQLLDQQKELIPLLPRTAEILQQIEQLMSSCQAFQRVRYADQQALAQYQQALEAHQASQQQLEQAIAQWGEPAALEQQHQQQQQLVASGSIQLQRLRTFGEALSLHLQHTQQLQAVQEQQQTQHTRYQVLQHQLPGQLAQLEQEKVRLTAIQQLVQRQQTLTHQTVSTLRQQLQEGEPCSVCGSVEHPFRITEQLVQQLGQQQDEELARQQHTVSLAQEAYFQSKAEAGITLQRLNELKVELNQLVSLNTHYQNQCLQALAELADLADLTSLSRPGCVITLHTPIEELRQYYREAEQALKQQDQHLADSRHRLTQLKELQASHNHAQLTLTDRQQHCAQTQVQVQELQQAQQLWYERLHSLLPAPWSTPFLDWAKRMTMAQSHSLTDMASAEEMNLQRETFQSLCHQLQAYQQRLQELRVLSDKEQQQRDLLQTQLNVLYSDCAQLTQQQQQLAIQRTDLLAQCQQLLHAAQGQPQTASDWQAQLDADQRNSLHALQITQLHLHEAEKREQQSQQAVQHLDEQVCQLATQCEQLLKQQQQWHHDHPDISSDDLSLLAGQRPDTIAAFTQQVSDAEHTQQRQQALCHSVRERLASHRKQQPELTREALQQASVEWQTVHTQVQADYHQQLAQLALDDRSRQQQQQLHQQLQQARQHYTRWHRVCSPISSNNGEAFRKVAQGYYLDNLLEQANLQLEGLSPRYRLQRAGNTLGLLVVDQDMGDDIRSVYSLSGGESFLMSLALALALAAMTSEQVQLEALFIDEGFGTLDPDSLGIVMDSLDRLQSQGRKVFVISHIPEVHERIPTQIQVIPTGEGKSRLEVI